MRAKWSLDPEDVVYRGCGSSSGKSRQFSRRLRETGYRIVLVHRPTGLEVQGEIPAGSFSKKEMQKLREELYRKLFAELEAKVARHLRAPGR